MASGQRIYHPRHVHMEYQISRIVSRIEADIVAVNADPWADIRELMDIDFVMSRGKVIKNED